MVLSPLIDISSSFETVKRKMKSIFWDSFLNNFDQENSCSYYFAHAHAQVASLDQNHISTVIKHPFGKLVLL